MAKVTVAGWGVSSAWERQARQVADSGEGDTIYPLLLTSLLCLLSLPAPRFCSQLSSWNNPFKTVSQSKMALFQSSRGVWCTQRKRKSHSPQSDHPHPAESACQPLASPETPTRRRPSLHCRHTDHLVNPGNPLLPQGLCTCRFLRACCITSTITAVSSTLLKTAAPPGSGPCILLLFPLSHLCVCCVHHQKESPPRVGCVLFTESSAQGPEWFPWSPPSYPDEILVHPGPLSPPSTQPLFPPSFSPLQSLSWSVACTCRQ